MNGPLGNSECRKIKHLRSIDWRDRVANNFFPYGLIDTFTASKFDDGWYHIYY